MEVIIIEKKTFEKIVSDALALEKQVNALCAMNEGKPANAWLDGEGVCRRLHISPRRLQTLRNSRRLNYALYVFKQKCTTKSQIKFGVLISLHNDN